MILKKEVDEILDTRQHRSTTREVSLVDTITERHTYLITHDNKVY